MVLRVLWVDRQILRWTDKYYERKDGWTDEYYQLINKYYG